MVVIAAIITEVHKFFPTISSCNVPFADTTNRLLDFILMLISNHKRNLVFDLILRMLVEQEVEMIRFGLMLRRNEQRIDLTASLIELPDLPKDDLAHQKVEDLIGLLMIFFEIDMPAEEQDILQRNDLIYYFVLVLRLVISHIYQGVQLLLLL